MVTGHVMIVICVKQEYVLKPFIKRMGGLKMGLTQDQKIDLAIAYVNQCTDEELVEDVFWVAYERLLDLNLGPAGEDE
jgi:hypothetical protein